MKKVIGLILVALFVMSIPVMAGGWTEPKVWDQCGESVDRMPWYDAESKTLYFCRDYNLYQSQFADNKWSKPVQVEIPGINVRQNQVSPVKRGNHLYFASFSPATDYDFYMSTWNQTTQSWGEAAKLETINSDGQDWALWVSKDENEAYLISQSSFAGKNVRGGRGVWKAIKENGEWTTPVPLEGDINSEVNEWSVFKEENSGKIYINSNREGAMGSYDIWVLDNDDAKAVNLGSPINTKLSERSLWTDGRLMFFTGLNYENGVGGYDIFVSFYK
ncbi:MAG: hypothetical protein KAX49_04490 [Halanaerobiales bacterium]|nr:hypothetical protein [Halanaerobiales bacterium]